MSFLPDLNSLLVTIVVNALRLLPVVLLLVVVERIVNRKRHAPPHHAQRNYSHLSARTDFGYLALTLFYAPLARHFGTLVFGSLLVYWNALPAWTSGLAALPVLAQVLVLLFFRDVLIYVRHRLFHGRRLWPFHAVHHSSTQVNWLSTVRFHPGEALIEVSINLLLFAALMPSQDAILISATVMGFYDYFIHSDIPLSYGFLNYVLVSPTFHRWHHSTDSKARDKNFAAMFSCLDLLGGTYYMPKDCVPTETGIKSRSDIVPESLWGQMKYPFLRHSAKRTPTPAKETLKN